MKTINKIVNKTKTMIMGILTVNGELNLIQIGDIFKHIEYKITNDTLAKNLKEMTDSKELTRYGKKKEGDIAWYYYYQINPTNN